MTTPLPEVHDSSPESHAAMSRRLLTQAREELQQEDRLQASEKVWGAAAHAVKAIAEQRGWNHNGHYLIFDAARQVGMEFTRDESFFHFINIASAMHRNYYENEHSSRDIESALNAIEIFVDEVEAMRASPPRPFTVQDTEDAKRLNRLTGLQVEVGAYSPNGFVQPQRRTGNGLEGTENPAH